MLDLSLRHFINNKLNTQVSGFQVFCTLLGVMETDLVTQKSPDRLLSNTFSEPTEQEELPAVPVELSQVNAELVDGGAVSVLMEQGGKLLDLL